MENYAYELSILSRAVAFPNLSTASVQIGISQPQLSRIIAKIEQELKVVLLERQSRRHSSWTAMAFKLAENYTDMQRKFDAKLREIIAGEELDHIKIGTLEGLMSFALNLSEQLFEKADLKFIEVNVYDRDQLDSLFLKGELDLVLTSEQLIARKNKYEVVLGHQVIELKKTNDKYLVKSSFEFSTSQRKLGKVTKKFFVSNSLEARKLWLEKYGGEGVVPSSIFMKSASRSQDTKEVILLGHESLSTSLWDKIKKFKIIVEK